MNDDTHEQLHSSYLARFDQRVRDLAEVIYIATECSAEGRDFLATGRDDPLADVFAEMIDLYSERHGISAIELAGAVRAFARADGDAPAGMDYARVPHQHDTHFGALH